MTSIKTIKTSKEIDSAIHKAVWDTSNGKVFNQITKSEMKGIINAARCDDGKVSRDEAKYVALKMLDSYYNRTPAANAELSKLMGKFQITESELWR